MHSGNHGNLQQTNVPDYQTVHNDFVELPRSGTKDADVDWASPSVSTKPSAGRHRHPSSRTTRPAAEDVPSHQTQSSIPTAHVTPTTPVEPKHRSRESLHKRTSHVSSPEHNLAKHHGKVVAEVPENKHSKENDKRVIDFDETCKDFKMPNLEHTMNMTSHFTVLPAEQTFNKSRFEHPPDINNHLPPGTIPNQSKHSSYANQAVGYHSNHQQPMPAFPQQQRLYDPSSYSFPSANTSARTSYLGLPNALGDRSPPNPEATSSYIPNSAPYHSSSNLQVPNLYVQPGGLQLSPESNVSSMHPASGFSQHGLPQENMAGVPGFFKAPPDLTQWQQVQQLQLNQHLEHLEQQKRELMQQQQVYSSQSSPQYPSANNGLNNDPGRWDALVKVKDAILKEKDNIIYKQKQQLAQFQRQSREQDIRLRTTLRRTPGEEDVFNLKLQEYEYENASLKAQLAEATAAKDAEIEALNKKLGETEYEMQQLQEAVKQSSQEDRQEVTRLQNKLKDRDKMVGDLKKKTKHAMEKYEKYKKRVESLERYLGDLPTQEEAKKRADQTSKEEVSQLRERVVDLEDKLSMARKDNKQKDATVDSLEQKEQELVSMVTSLQKELARWRDRGKQEERDAASQEDVEELKFENDRLREDCDRAKKLLESKHKKMKALQSQHQTELEKLEERVAQEEGVVTALREEIRGKDEATRKLRESMKELASQNQDLLEQTMTLQEQLQELQRLNSAENTKLSQRLYRELGVCQSELQALVQVLMQRAEGKEPNMSILLGLKEPSTPPDDEQQGQNGHNLKTKLAQIRELRKEVDHLRSLISNKYAEDMGDNCIMQ